MGIFAKILVTCLGAADDGTGVCMVRWDMEESRSRLECTRDAIGYQATVYAASGVTPSFSMSYCADADKAGRELVMRSEDLLADGYLQAPISRIGGN